MQTPMPVHAPVQATVQAPVIKPPIIPHRLVRVTDDLFISDIYSAQQRELLIQADIFIVYNLSGIHLRELEDVEYINHTFNDYELTKNELEYTLGRVEKIIDIIHGYINSGFRVLVCCLDGANKAPTIGAGYLVRHHGCTVDQAVLFISDSNDKLPMRINNSEGGDDVLMQAPVPKPEELARLAELGQSYVAKPEVVYKKTLTNKSLRRVLASIKRPN